MNNVDGVLYLFFLLSCARHNGGQIERMRDARNKWIPLNALCGALYVTSARYYKNYFKEQLNWTTKAFRSHSKKKEWNYFDTMRYAPQKWEYFLQVNKHTNAWNDKRRKIKANKIWGEIEMNGYEESK